MDDAVQLLERVTSRYPEDAWTPLLQVALGDLLRDRGRYDDALTLFAEAEEARFQHPVVEQYTNYYAAGFRGMTLLELGLLKLSVHSFDPPPIRWTPDLG